MLMFPPDDMLMFHFMVVCVITATRMRAISIALATLDATKLNMSKSEVPINLNPFQCMVYSANSLK